MTHALRWHRNSHVLMGALNVPTVEECAMCAGTGELALPDVDAEPGAP